MTEFVVEFCVGFKVDAEDVEDAEEIAKDLLYQGKLLSDYEEMIFIGEY